MSAAHPDYPEQTTANGAHVNPYSGLCRGCAHGVAQSAAYWTDDANFEGDDGHGWTEADRFAQIQREVTDSRRNCVKNCGRRVPPKGTADE